MLALELFDQLVQILRLVNLFSQAILCSSRRPDVRGAVATEPAPRDRQDGGGRDVRLQKLEDGVRGPVEVRQIRGQRLHHLLQRRRL